MKRMLAILLLSACTGGTPDPLADKTIVIDPGHGGTAEYDQYRVGPAGEREEWVNLRVALLLRDKLEARGARVLLTRTEDVEVALDVRARLAVENDADAFVSVHHNATADPDVNFPIVYYHANASENEMESYARRHTPGIRDDGIRHVLAGSTTLEEVLRVTTAD